MRYVFFTLLALNVAYFFASSYLGEQEVPDTASPPVLPADVERLRLLSEAGGEDARQASISDAISNPVREGDEGLTRINCDALGPFPDVFSGQAVVEQLASLDLATEVRAVDRETGERDYRVMIPPVNSLEEAFRKLRELKSRSIDSYVITEGQDTLAISLGVFSTREAAQEAQNQRSREGYQAVVVEIPRLAREFWIFGQGDDVAFMLEPEVWESLRQRQEGLARRAFPCPGSTTSN